MIKRDNLLYRNKRGTTLVEAVCGLLILSIVLVAIYSGFIAAQKAIGEGDTHESNGQEAFSKLENGEGSPGIDEEINLRLGAGKITINGNYNKAGDDEKGATLYSFESK